VLQAATVDQPKESHPLCPVLPDQGYPDFLSPAAQRPYAIATICLHCNGTGFVGMSVDPVTTHTVSMVQSSTFPPAVLETTTSESPEDGNGWWPGYAYAWLGRALV